MAHVLNIRTLIERPKIDIDGERYEIVSPNELSIVTTQRVAELGRKLDQLVKSDGLDEAGGRELSDTLQTLGNIIMEPVPVDVRAKLTDAHRQSVIEVFTMLSLARKTKLAGAAIEAMLGTIGFAGAKPPQGSSGSTAATRSAG